MLHILGWSCKSLKLKMKIKFDKYMVFFIAQFVAFWLLVIGMLIFVYMWYKGHA
jgi:hypothetical protein